VARKTAIDDGRGLKGLGTAWVHVAAKEEHTRRALRRLHGQGERNTSTVAPADERRVVDAQHIHDGPHIRCHARIGVRLCVACASAVPTAINDDGPVARSHECRNLIPPIAAMAEPAMQQDHRPADAEGRIPDAGAVVLDMALRNGGRQRSSTVGGKACQIVVEGVHVDQVSAGRAKRRVAPAFGITVGQLVAAQQKHMGEFLFRHDALLRSEKITSIRLA
jgi:hypothetical protein